MAICQTDNSKLFGRAIVLEVADGCADTVPTEAQWKALAAGTSKGFDFSPNTVTSDADVKWSTKTGHHFRVFPVSVFRFVWW